MIARKTTNLSHPKQTKLKVRIGPLQVEVDFETALPASDEPASDQPFEPEILQQRLVQREDVRRRLLEADLLVTDIDMTDIIEDWDEEEFAGFDLPIQLPPNSKTIAEWLEEERGEY